MDLYAEGAVSTHVGNIRLKNEDNYNLFGMHRKSVEERIRKDSKTMLLHQTAVAVFDGMGGEMSGEVASLIGAEMITPCTLDRIEDVEQQILTVNDVVCAERKQRGGIRMGATVAALYLDNNMAVSCNVGDSRCYFLRNGVLQLLSVDHSEAGKLIEMGILSEEEARRGHKWHALTQYLGISKDEFIIEPYFSQKIELQPKDIFLLCTDGLTDMVMDEEIKSILQASGNVEEKADTLIDVALQYGGRDNVTSLVLQIQEA